MLNSVLWLTLWSIIFECIKKINLSNNYDIEQNDEWVSLIKIAYILIYNTLDQNFIFKSYFLANGKQHMIINYVYTTEFKNFF